MSQQSIAQGSESYGTGLKVNIKPDGSSYVRFIIWNQVWARAIENNPGTVVNASPENTTFDIGIRRARLLAYAQISPRYLILTHFGINNQTFVNGGNPGGGITGNGGSAFATTGKKPALFFHDVWNEYALIQAINPETKEKRKFNLHIGFGLHYWNGISRMTSGSTLNFLAIDAPIFNWPTIELSDQFARQFGIYAKGKFGKLDYRLMLNKPFATNLLPGNLADGSPRLNVAVDNNMGHNSWVNGGYLMYQFLDQESNLLPFTVGSYVGTKKVFNVGAGWHSQKNGTASYQKDAFDSVSLASHSINLFGLDVFADLPFGGDKKMAFTGYSVLYLHNWGPNYYRTVGIMNEGTLDPNFKGLKADNGAGNARPLLGTGQIWYTQAGILLPKDFITQKARFQPFAAATMQNFEALNKEAWSYDIGANCFIDGHHAKVTFQYSRRPLIFDKTPSGGRGEFLIQTQIFL